MNKSLFSKVADQVTRGVGVSRTVQSNLAVKRFHDGDRTIVAIQQNPNTRSEWARLAQRGHKVVQFKDAETNRYVGVSVDGKIQEY